jgi:hypothetical protein
MEAAEPKHPVETKESPPIAVVPAGQEPIHPLQRLMENPWLLLVLGIVIPFVSYLLWGWIELASVTEARLP